MQFINTFSYYINMIGAVTIFTLLLMVGILYYLIKVKKITARQENINTANFKREDAVNYVPLKDIVSRDGKLDSDGMIVISDTAFVGGISVRGFDYPSASMDEQIAAQVNSVSFFNVVEKPTSFRQSIRAVDLTVNEEEYHRTRERLKEELLSLKVEQAETLESSEAFIEEEESYGYYQYRLKELARQIRAKEHMIEECSVLLTAFVGGISVRGFDYPSASMDEQIAAQVNSVSFFNVVEKPTSFRQSIRAVDLTVNEEEYHRTRERLKEELLSLKVEQAETLESSEAFIEEEESYGYYQYRLKELARQIRAKEHMIEECSVLLRYMDALGSDAARGGGNRVGQRTNQIMFSYTYNEDEFTQPLSKEEVYVKAMDELGRIALSYGEALAACHFRSKRLSARELIGFMRKHTSPITGESINLDELLDSSYTSLFVSSDSLVEKIKERIGEGIYELQVKEQETAAKSALEKQIRARYVQGELLLEKAYAKALAEMGLEE